MGHCDAPVEDFCVARVAYMLQIFQFCSIPRVYPSVKLSEAMHLISDALHSNLKLAEKLKVAIKYNLEISTRFGQSETAELEDCKNRIVFLMKMFFVAHRRYEQLVVKYDIPLHLRRFYDIMMFSPSVVSIPCSDSARRTPVRVYSFFTDEEFDKLIKATKDVSADTVAAEISKLNID